MEKKKIEFIEIKKPKTLYKTKSMTFSFSSDEDIKLIELYKRDKEKSERIKQRLKYLKAQNELKKRRRSQFFKSSTVLNNFISTQPRSKINFRKTKEEKKECGYCTIL